MGFSEAGLHTKSTNIRF